MGTTSWVLRVLSVTVVVGLERNSTYDAADARHLPAFGCVECFPGVHPFQLELQGYPHHHGYTVSDLKVASAHSKRLAHPPPGHLVSLHDQVQQHLRIIYTVCLQAIYVVTSTLAWDGHP